jgi:hypothetical protein
MKEKPKRGRGRPRKERHLGELRELGAPPCADLLDLANWVHLAVAITARPDRGTAEMGSALRALAIALGKLLPAGIAAQAQGTINAGEIDPDGPPPVDDPLLRSVWLTRILANEMFEVIEGRSTRSRRETLVGVARAMVATLPPDAYHAAGEILRQRAHTETFSRSDPRPEPLPAAPSLNLHAQCPG